LKWVSDFPVGIPDFGSGSSEGHRPPISRAPTHRVLVCVNLGGAKADVTVKSEGSIESLGIGKKKWDEQIEDDMAAGRLDRLADQAICEHEAGESTGLSMPEPHFP